MMAVQQQQNDESEEAREIEIANPWNCGDGNGRWWMHAKSGPCFGAVSKTRLPMPRLRPKRTATSGMLALMRCGKVCAPPWCLSLPAMMRVSITTSIYASNKNGQRWPGLVPMRTSRSPEDTLLVLQRPEFTADGMSATVTAQVFISGTWTTHSVELQNVAGTWTTSATNDVAADAINEDQ